MASNNIFQKAEDWLDDLETVGTYAAEKIGDVTKNMPIVKALGNIAANPTKQEIGSQVAYLASATNKGLQESFGGDPVDMALNYGPNAMGTIVGKSAAGWAKLPNKFSNMLDKMERAEISDVGSSINYPTITERVSSGIKNKKIVDFTLGEIYDHPKLYEQYPELKNAIIIPDEMIQGERGAYIGLNVDGQPMIRVNKDLLFFDDTKQTLLHEIQHAIQEQEGFARGGSPEAASSGARALMKQRNSRLNEIAFAQHNQPFPSLDIAGQDNVMSVFLKENPEIARQVESIQGVNSFDLYKRLGGEIESRSVASRSNIPQEQLKYSQPYAGENIPLKEWIKAEDFLDGPSMSIDRELTKEFIPRDYMGGDRYIFKIDGERVGDSLFTVQSIPKQNNPFLNFPELAGNKIGYSNLVGVEQKHQGKGIGREILKNLEGEARKKGAGYFMFTSVLPEAEGFYSKNGYVIDRNKRVAVKKIADTAEDFLDQ